MTFGDTAVSQIQQNAPLQDPTVGLCLGSYDTVTVQGYLTHKKCTSLGLYSRTMPWALWWSKGRGLFLMGQVLLDLFG